MKLRVPVHAYRLRYPDSPNAPEMLWEWEDPYINHLLWHAKTFEHEVVQCYFVDWHAIAAAHHPRCVTVMTWKNSKKDAGRLLASFLIESA